jgi:hypothetical protein
MIDQEKAPARSEAPGQGRNETNCGKSSTSNAKTQVLKAAAHYVANHALIAASVCLHLCAGRSPEAVAADIAGRAVKALKGKGNPRA